MANPLEWENKNALLVQGLVEVVNEIKTAPGGVPKWIIDETPNDSDKEIVVPAGKIWELRGIFTTLVASAKVGSRSLRVILRDNNNKFLTLPRLVVVTASQLGGLTLSPNTTFESSTSNMVGLTNSALNVNIAASIPLMYLPAGYKIRVADVNAVDAESDNLFVNIHVIEYNA